MQGQYRDVSSSSSKNAGKNARMSAAARTPATTRTLKTNFKPFFTKITKQIFFYLKRLNISLRDAEISRLAEFRSYGSNKGRKHGDRVFGT
jgi:hypothetical protein